MTTPRSALEPTGRLPNSPTCCGSAERGRACTGVAAVQSPPFVAVAGDHPGDRNGLTFRSRAGSALVALAIVATYDESRRFDRGRRRRGDRRAPLASAPRGAAGTR